MLNADVGLNQRHRPGDAVARRNTTRGDDKFAGKACCLLRLFENLGFWQEAFRNINFAASLPDRFPTHSQQDFELEHKCARHFRGLLHRALLRDIVARYRWCSIAAGKLSMQN